ncbi:shikimate kinase [Brevibacillus ginsengisoli]|uniref:shikimate kinase n=1 Tax=Brevibacillus ginsengisoli TaxID=363854 RepID=UPI003CEE6120
MGTGKSTIGSLLAKRLGMTHVDLDQAIVESEGVDIPTIFKEKGESYFREVETHLLAKLLDRKSQVITTGGGAVLRSENVKQMMNHSLVIGLYADADEIISRVTADQGRPLLAGNPAERVVVLLEERKGAYDFAMIQINTTKKQPDAIIEEILKRMVEYQVKRQD